MTWPPKPKPKALWVGLAGGIKPRGFQKSGSRVESKSNSGLKRNKRLRARSKVLTKRMKVYRARREDFLRRNPFCSVFPTLRATEIHHKHGRIAALLLDERFWVSVSLEGHQWIGANPNAARAKNLLCAVGQWNVPVAIEEPQT